MLQTLTRNAIAKYLPANIVAPYAGTHLNVALPLHQAPFSAMVDTQDPSMYHTSDPLVAQYFTSLRRRFYELKVSPNKVPKQYYASVIRQRVVTRVTTNQKSFAEALHGVEKLLKVRTDVGRSHQQFYLAHFSFHISLRWTILEHNSPVQVRLELAKKGDIPSHVYCVNATKDDPAARLAVFIEGTSRTGVSFSGWLQSKSTKKIMKMNTLVDILDGGSMTTSRHLPRRWIRIRFQNQQTGKLIRRGFYTDNNIG